MDRHRVTWIMEFVLRQPIEDWLANEILLRLPSPPLLDPHLKKTLLLRRLSSAAPLSDLTLQSLELLEELDRSLGAPQPCEALTAAYCVVAAELTVAPLRRGAEVEFLDAVDRIWNCRVADLERSDARGLAGEGLREWRRAVEDAVAGDAGRARLLRRDTKGEAEAALMEYLRVTLEGMGPPLLELAARAVRGGAGAGRGVPADLRATSRVDAEPSGVSGEPGVSTRVSPADLDGVAAATGARGVLPAQEEERLEGIEQAGQRESRRKDRILELHLLPIPEVNEDSVDLPEAAVNPLPEAPASAGEIQNGMAKAPTGPNDTGGDQNPSDMDAGGSSVEKDAQATTTEETVVEEGQQVGEHRENFQNGLAEAPSNPSDSGNNQNLANKDMAGPSVEKDAQATSTKGDVVKDQQGEQRAKMPRTSLMERNPTARTCQWDEDSVESLPEKLEDSPKRPHLSTPRVQRVSPLKLYKDTQYVRRRKNKRWTPQEEDSLRVAVKKHGVGNWKCILQHCPGAFEDRTEVDLKDKWRNMSRYKL